MCENLIGQTTREILFHDSTSKAFVTGVRRPAGTEVYVTCLKSGSGMFRVRIPGTLLEQDVPMSAVEPF